MQQARNIKPTVQWVARGPIKQAEKDTGKQAIPVHKSEPQILDGDQQVWQKAKGRGGQPSPSQHTLTTTNGFSPLRVKNTGGEHKMG